MLSGAGDERGVDVGEGDVSAHELILRAFVRALSGDVTAAASAGVKRRMTDWSVVPLMLSVAEEGQMIRIAFAAGALMFTSTPCPA